MAARDVKGLEALFQHNYSAGLGTIIESQFQLNYVPWERQLRRGLSGVAKAGQDQCIQREYVQQAHQKIQKSNVRVNSVCAEMWGAMGLVYLKQVSLLVVEDKQVERAKSPFNRHIFSVCKFGPFR